MAKKKPKCETTTINGVVLDVPCKYCRGTGTLIEIAQKCVYCGGVGVKLTDDGTALMAFIRRHLTANIVLGHQ